MTSGKLENVNKKNTKLSRWKSDSSQDEALTLCESFRVVEMKGGVLCGVAPSILD